jgi:hypothetical protein
MGGALLLAEVFQGDFKKLVPLIAVAAIGCISAALASSLLRGRGVPIWFLRGFWIAGVIGFSIAFVNECWRWIQGQPIDITGNLLLSGLGIYGVLSMFSVFWKRGR